MKLNISPLSYPCITKLDMMHFHLSFASNQYKNLQMGIAKSRNLNTRLIIKEFEILSIFLHQSIHFLNRFHIQDDLVEEVSKKRGKRVVQEKTAYCSKCGKHFVNQESLDKHFRNVHEGKVNQGDKQWIDDYLDRQIVRKTT